MRASDRDFDAPRFTFGAFLRDRWASLLIGAFCVILAFGMLCALTTVQGAVMVAGFVTVCLVVMLVVEYRRRAAFYRELEGLIDSSVQACQVLSLIEEPAFLDGREAYAALDVISREASGELSAAREESEAFRTYIELWIHEAKTPIAAAKLILASMHGEQASKLKGELERIEAQVESALYYARSSSLSNDYFIRELRLASVVQDVCKRNARFLIERGVTPRIEVDPDRTVLADATWLGFVMSQIVVNAAKYGAREIRFSTEESGGQEGGRECEKEGEPKGDREGKREGGRIGDREGDGEPEQEGERMGKREAYRKGEPKGARKGEREGGRIGDREGGRRGDHCTVLEIADDGCGIAPADVPRVFERGFTGANGRAVGSATGMGLYLAADLCERMGLGIALASEEGSGTRVMISFPHDRRRLADAETARASLFPVGKGRRREEGGG